MKRSLLPFTALFGALVLTFFASPSVSSSATATPTPVPIGHPDFSSMKIFLGTWTCHQQVRGKDRVDTSTTTIGMNGQYMISHDVAPPFDKYRTRPISTTSYFTYNPTTRQWVGFYFDDFGDYGVGTSPGWSGNAMTTTSVMASDGSSGSDTLTKVSDTQTKDVATNKDAKGHVTHTTTVCTKSS